MNEFELQISIYIRSNRGDNLNVSEIVKLNATDFLDLAKVLGQFHDLAQSINAKRTK